MGFIGQFKRAWKFYRQADTVYSVHSPFFYNFITNVLDTSKTYYVFEDLERLRSKLKRINKEIPVADHGAGSRSGKKSHRKIRDLAQTALSSPNECRILFNAVIHFQSSTVLELGSSLGISTAYLASANKKATVHTIEGNPPTAYIAKRNFELLGLTNIRLHQGRFEKVLPDVYKENSSFDLIYIDGHHDEEATIRYFNQLCHHVHKRSVIILDDIYWSDGMLKAWNTIKNHPEVTGSVDIYTMGFIFFNEDITEKTHIQLLKNRWKPWALGIFG